jgi:DNA-directed RNA polymerase specialized sigma24 family protein
MSAVKLSRLCEWRLRGFEGADRDDVIASAMLKAFEAGADPAAELDDKYVKLAAQGFRDANNAAKGKPSRYAAREIMALEKELETETDGKRRGKVKERIYELRGPQRAEAADDIANASDSPAPFDELLANLTPKERKALIRVDVSTIAPAVERSIREKVADVAAAAGESVPPPLPAGEPAERAPAQIDSDTGMQPHAPQGGSGKKCCASRCWQCSYDQGFMPDLTSILRTDRTDADVQDVEMLVNWRKIAIANAHSNTPRIAWHLFDFPLVVDGRDIRDSVLTAYLPATAAGRWSRWRDAIETLCQL